MKTSKVTGTRAEQPGVSRPGVALFAVCLGFFMVILDTMIVNVALPDLGRDFGAGVSGLQWIVNAYTLMLAALMLGAGSLSDRLGSRRVFQIGLWLFILASVACGLASTTWILVVARFAEGAGGALLLPTSLALIRAIYDDQKARARAIGIWGGIGGVAAAAGPVLGGILVSGFSWRAVFLVNVPVGLIGLLLSARYVPAPPARSGKSLDLPGQVAAILWLGGLSLALIESGDGRWSSVPALAGFALFAVALPAFLLAERRGEDPLLPLDLFRSPAFSAASAVGWLINFGFFAQVFLMSLYFQQLRGYTALATGLLLLPMAAMAMIGSPLGGRFTGRFGPRLPMMAGLLVGAIGLFGLTIAGAHTPYPLLIAPLVATGLGMSFTMPAATAAVVEAAPADRAGIASGVINASRQAGGVVGVGLLGGLVAGPHDFISGLHLALVLAGGAFVLGCILTLLGVERRRTVANTGSN